MFDIKHGSRGGGNAALMLGAVANLTDEDVLNLSAYIASLEP
jgi:cytochrome c553